MASLQPDRPNRNAGVALTPADAPRIAAALRDFDAAIVADDPRRLREARDAVLDAFAPHQREGCPEIDGAAYDLALKVALRDIRTELLRTWSFFPSAPGEDDDPWFDQTRLKIAEVLVLLGRLTPRPNPNDARDRFIYKSMRRGLSLAEIKNQIEARARKRSTWGLLDSPPAVSQAARRYAIRRGLPWPIPRDRSPKR